MKRKSPIEHTVSGYTRKDGTKVGMYNRGHGTRSIRKKKVVGIREKYDKKAIMNTDFPMVGHALLSPNLSKNDVDDVMRIIKKKLGGIKILGNKKMLWVEGPPGFTYTMGTDIAWRISWKPYEGETQRQQERWSESLPLSMGAARRNNAIDLMRV